MGFRVDMRAAAVTLLEGYAAANAGTLRQVYPGRPASLYPPLGFVDTINEPEIVLGAGPTQRQPSVEVILLQGVYDSEEAATAQDALVDGFIDHIRANIHASGTSTLVAQTISYADIPNYQPDWIVDAPIYYATRFTFVGLKQEGPVTI